MESGEKGREEIGMTGRLPLEWKTKRRFVLQSSLGATWEEGVINQMVRHSPL